MTEATAPATASRRFAPLPLFLLGLKLLKSVKVVKLALVGASVGAYAWLYSWPFAVALILGLSLHEYGHVRAMRRCGLKTRGFYLIPFVGGVALADEAFRSRWDHLYVAAMGPVWGLATLPLIGGAMWALFGASFAAATVSMLALVNLFNLLPIRPLDGGRMLSAVALSADRRLGIGLMALALAGGVVLFLSMGAWTFGVLLAIALIDLVFEIRAPMPEHRLTRSGMIAGVAWWLALAAAFVGVVVACALVPGADLAQHILLAKE